MRSPKLEWYEGRSTRIVPIFPELLEQLEQAWDEAAEGEEYVITRYHTGRFKNPGTQLKRIIERAGIRPWPKPWQNVRASRATELTREYPRHVAAAWLGHSVAVAEEHY